MARFLPWEVPTLEPPLCEPFFASPSKVKTNLTQSNVIRVLSGADGVKEIRILAEPITVASYHSLDFASLLVVLLPLLV